MKKTLFRRNLVFQLALLWGIIFFFPGASFCQEPLKNTISLTFSPIHLFYDGLGIHNKNDGPELVKYSWRDPFYGKLRYALGFRYSRQLSSNYSMDVDFYKFSAAYLRKDMSEFASNQYNLLSKFYYASSVSVNRVFSINDKLKPRTGLGFLFRKNTDQFLKTLGYCPNCSVMGFRYIRYEIGVNLRVGLNYQWTKRMSTFFEVNQNFILYQSDSFNRNKFFDSGLPQNHFSKIETIANFGIGFSF